MKILGIILAVLMLASTAFVALAAANKSFKLAGDLAKVTEGLTADQIKMIEKSGEVPSGGRLKGGAVIGGLGGLAAIVLLIAAFAKKQWVKGLAGATVACAAISAVVYPYVKTGPLDGAAPRSLAFVAIGLAVVGALGAWLAARPKA
jgi:hypothetical protein